MYFSCPKSKNVDKIKTLKRVFMKNKNDKNIPYSYEFCYRKNNIRSMRLTNSR